MTNLMTGLQQNMTQNFSDLQQSMTSWCETSEDYYDYENYDYENTEDTNNHEPPSKKQKSDENTGEAQISPVDLLLRRDSSASQNCESYEQNTEKTVSGDTNLSQKSGNENILTSIAQKMNISEPVGESVNSQLAEIINGLLFKTEKPDFDKMKEKMEAIKRPENCKSLVTTKVDELIWLRLAPHSRTLDTKFQTVHTGLVKAATLLTRMIDVCLSKRAGSESALDCDSIIKQTFEALELIAYANFELNLRRRDCIKPELNDEYMGLFSASVPINDMLFGGNTSKRLEDIDKCNKAVNKAMPTASGRRKMRFRGAYRPFGRRGRGRGFSNYGNRYKTSPGFGYGGSYGFNRGGNYGSFLGRGYNTIRPKKRGDGKRK